MKHLESQRKERRRRPLWLLVIAFLSASVVAVAAFLSMKESQIQTFSTESVGEVNIGNLDGAPLFDVTTLNPGDSIRQCMAYKVGEGTGKLKLYAKPTDFGELADYATLKIAYSKVREGVAPGKLASCPPLAAINLVTVFPTALVNTLPTDYASGIDLPVESGTIGSGNEVTMQFTLSLPKDVGDGAAGTTMDLGFIWHNE